jgi:hypothetical protein
MIWYKWRKYTDVCYQTKLMLDPLAVKSKGPLQSIWSHGGPALLKKQDGRSMPRSIGLQVHDMADALVQISFCESWQVTQGEEGPRGKGARPIGSIAEISHTEFCDMGTTRAGVCWSCRSAWQTSPVQLRLFSQRVAGRVSGGPARR